MPLRERGGTAKFGGVADCCVLWLGGRKTTNFEVLGAIAAGGRGGVTTNFGGVDVVPLLGAIRSNGIQTNCLEFLADVTLFSTLITQKLVFAIWGLCWYNSWC